LTRHEAVHAVGSLVAGQIYQTLSERHEADRNVYEAQLRELTADSWQHSGSDDSDTDETAADSRDGREPADLDDIVAELCVPAPAFPAAAIRAAARARGHINERLLTVIADTHRAALEGRIDPSNGHIFAMLLLAHFEDARAFDAIAQFLSLPGSMLDKLVGAFLTEDLGRVLASVCGGRIEPLASLVEDRTRDQFVRAVALSAVAALVQRRVVARDDAAAYLQQLFGGRLEQEPSAVWDEAGNLVLDLYVEDLFAEVHDAIRRGVIASYAISPDDIEQTRREGRDAALAHLAANVHHYPVRDVVAETQWWNCFQPDDESAASMEPCSDPQCEEHGPASPTLRRAVPKVGRNDPCPCGSGKKYKKCCL
jgi:hypothetical protein